MPTLKIDLQDDFAGETVVLRLNGNEVYRGAPRTRRQIGLAESRSFIVPAQHITVEVAIPQSGVSKSLDLDVFRDMYVGVKFSPEKELLLHSSSEPFGYV
jgi:hypothetical protein